MEKPTEILSDALPPHPHCIDNHSPLEDDTWMKYPKPKVLLSFDFCPAWSMEEANEAKPKISPTTTTTTTTLASPIFLPLSL